MDFLYLIIAAFAVATNVIWYRMKFVLRSRGYPISYLFHFQDLGHFRALIAKESNPVRRARYSRLQTALYASLAVAICLFMTIPFWQIAGDIISS